MHVLQLAYTFLNVAVSSPHVSNLSLTKCCALFHSQLNSVCVLLSGGPGVRAAERRSIQQGQPNLSPLEDQQQEVRTDFPEPRRRPRL